MATGRLVFGGGATSTGTTTTQLGGGSSPTTLTQILSQFTPSAPAQQAPAPAPTLPAPSSAVLTKLQFRRLFTLSERISIDNLQFNVSFTGAQKATVSTIQKDLEVAEEIRLNDPATTGGVMFLMSIGLLSQARAARILANLPPL